MGGRGKQKSGMEGLFHSTNASDSDVYWGSLSEYDNCRAYWRYMMLECDIGPFKKGEVVDRVHYSNITHVLELSKDDEHGEEVAKYSCKVNVSYVVPTLARTDEPHHMVN